MSRDIPSNLVSLAACPPGLFRFNGELCFKSEYRTTRENGSSVCDAYVVASGEYFWGGTSVDVQREALKVQPVTVETPASTDELLDNCALRGELELTVEHLQQANSELASCSTDARRYQRLRVLGCAVGGTPQLDAGLVSRFTNLDAIVDEDIAAHPDRGEAKALAPAYIGMDLGSPDGDTNAQRAWFQTGEVAREHPQMFAGELIREVYRRLGPAPKTGSAQDGPLTISRPPQ